MKRILFSILAILFLALLVISSNKPWMEAIADYRFYSPWDWLGPHKHGDLYNLCFIQDYKEPITEPVFKKYNTEKKNTDLYILHDSYLQYILNTNNFRGIDSLQQIDYRNRPATKVLNPARASVLIIETAQRYARWRLQNPLYYINALVIAKQIPGRQEEAQYIQEDTSNWITSLLAKRFNPNINSNLEFNLFDYAAFSPVRGWKSGLNYGLFNKLNKQIVISKDRKYLLLEETVDTLLNTGIYTPLPEAELDSMVAHMALIRNHFLGCGFKEVYYSIIPNTITVLDSNYFPQREGNGLIYKIKAKAESRQIPYIDIYSLFLKNPDKMYKHGDSHWTDAGKQIWIDQVNETLIK